MTKKEKLVTAVRDAFVEVVNSVDDSEYESAIDEALAEAREEAADEAKDEIEDRHKEKNDAISPHAENLLDFLDSRDGTEPGYAMDLAEKKRLLREAL